MVSLLLHIVGGSSYTTDTNDLTGVSTVEGATTDGSITAVTGESSFTASTNNLSSLSKSLNAIKGANFATATDSLHNISDNTVTVPLATSA